MNRNQCVPRSSPCPHVIMQVTVPGATDKAGGMKLIDVLGRLLLLALRKTGSAARFCVAAGAVASLAGGCCLKGGRGSLG